MGTSDERRGELIEKGITVVTLEEKERVTINSLISDKGGQGDVYHVSYRGKNYAMKWYGKHNEDVIGGPQYETIKKIYGEGKKPDDKFIWPLFMVTEERGKRFGYLMELLPKGYYEMADFLRKDGDSQAIRFKSYNAMLVAGMNIAYEMQKLHLKGYSYKDLNPKNFAINPETGDVLIIDNDNVSVEGKLCTVKGTHGYMAPEVVRNNENPHRGTDYYSLAVILYRLFFIDHPMEGKLWEKVEVCSPEEEERLYEIEPVFHFDPKDNRNRPTDVYAPNAVRRWRVLPQEIRPCFIDTFTEGIDHPDKRWPDGAWINAIAKCRDKLIRLKGGAEQFVNFEDAASIPSRCLGMKIGGHRIALYHGKAIYQVSVDSNTNQYARKVAGILDNQQLGVLTLRNLTNEAFRGWSPKTKQWTVIPEGKDYPVFPGVKIEFREKPCITGEVFDVRVRR